MKKENDPKKVSIKEKKVAERNEIRQFILDKTDIPLKRELSDPFLDKKLEKDFLTGYRDNNPIRKYIVDQIKPYLVRFPLEFYKLIYKLHGWPTDGDKLYNRPGIVGHYTNQIIYNRFPPEVLQKLRAINPLTSNGLRLHKHFQYLTILGEKNLETFIADSIAMMNKAKHWDHFKRLMAIEFKIAYQGALFED